MLWSSLGFSWTPSSPGRLKASWRSMQDKLDSLRAHLGGLDFNYADPYRWDAWTSFSKKQTPNTQNKHKENYVFFVLPSKRRRFSDVLFQFSSMTWRKRSGFALMSLRHVGLVKSSTVCWTFSWKVATRTVIIDGSSWADYVHWIAQEFRSLHGEGCSGQALPHQAGLCLGSQILLHCGATYFQVAGVFHHQ